MKRTLTIIATIVVPIILAVVWEWYPRASSESETEKVWRGWQGKADAPYYVATQVLADSGIILDTRRTLNKISTLDGYDALILNSSAELRNEQEREALQNWVKTGGHLLLPTDNMLAAQYGFQTEELASICASQADKSLHWITRQGTHLYPQAIVQQALQADSQALQSGTVCDEQIFVMTLPYGQGKVTAFTHDLTLWTQGEGAYIGMSAGTYQIPIALGDNAAYLHELVNDHTHVLLLRINTIDSVWQWPEAPWWAVLTGALLALLALLWYGGRRFGPLIAPDHNARLDIERHLQAAGYYWEKHAGYVWLAQAAKARLQSDLERCRRRLGSDAALENHLISRLGETAWSQFKQRPLPQTEAEFVQYLSALEAIRIVL